MYESSTIITDFVFDNPRRIRYSINEEKRTIVAYRIGIEEDLVDKIGRNVTWPDFDFTKCLILPEKIVAKAKCHIDDVWDVEVGKKIARDRLGRIYRKLARNACDKYMVKIKRHLNKMHDLKSKYDEREED